MKRTAKYLLACAVVVALSAALCGCSSTSGSSTYTPEKKTAQVSTPTIGQEGTLRVGVDSSSAPFAAQVSGKVVGLDVDVAAAIADQLGLDLEIIDVGSDPESALSEGSVDIVMSMDKNDTTTKCWLSNPYVQTGVALFATSSSTAMPTSTATGIEAQASSMSAWTVQNQFGTDALKSTTDLKTAFSDLQSGTAKYVAADAVIGSYVVHSADMNATIIGLLQTPSGYCIGVSSSNDALKTSITSALTTISNNGVLDVIQTKWLGSKLDLSKYKVSETATTSAKSSTSSSSSAITNTTDTTTTEVGSNAASIGGTSSGSTSSGTSSSGNSSSTSTGTSGTSSSGTSSTGTNTGATITTN